MKIIIDANILFAALIRDNKSRSLLVSENLKLYAPEFILDELEKYKSEILRKTGKSAEEFERVLAVLKRRLNTTSLPELTPFMKKAEDMAPDQKDVAYLALALKLKVPVWSNDKALKEKQATVKVYSTEEILSLVDE